MLNDFNQNKNDQNLDPLTEEPSFPMGKKIGFLFLGLTLIGLFVFFTSDFWTSGSSSSSIDELKEEVAKLQYRVNELEEQQLQAKQTPPSAPEFFAQKQQEPIASPQQPSIDNLQALIEQELRETATVEKASPKEEKAVVAKAAPEQKEKHAKTYTVKKGDTLSKISQQFYGTTKKWHKIVDANKEHLGHNQVLRAGMVLTIPQEA